MHIHVYSWLIMVFAIAMLAVAALFFAQRTLMRPNPSRPKTSYWNMAALLCYSATAFVLATNPRGSYPMLPLGAIILAILFGLAARRERTAAARGDGAEAR